MAHDLEMENMEKAEPWWQEKQKSENPNVFVRDENFMAMESITIERVNRELQDTKESTWKNLVMIEADTGLSWENTRLTRAAKDFFLVCERIGKLYELRSQLMNIPLAMNKLMEESRAYPWRNDKTSTTESEEEDDDHV